MDERVLSELVTASLVADLWGYDPAKVGHDILQYKLNRDKPKKPRQTRKKPETGVSQTEGYIAVIQGRKPEPSFLDRWSDVIKKS